MIYGETGHVAKTDTASPHCIPCSDAGQTNVAHYPGSGSCVAYKMAIEAVKKSKLRRA